MDNLPGTLAPQPARGGLVELPAILGAHTIKLSLEVAGPFRVRAKVFSLAIRRVEPLAERPQITLESRDGIISAILRRVHLAQLTLGRCQPCRRSHDP